MSLVAPIIANPAAPREALLAADSLQLQDELRRSFDAGFSLWDGESGELLFAPTDQPRGDEMLRAALCRAVAEKSAPQVVDDEGSVLLLALPIQAPGARPLVALAPFVTRQVLPGENLAGPARLL